MARRALIFTIFGFVCAFSITGCVQKEEYGSSKEIILTHSIDLPTKGNVIEEQNELINSNQEIGVTIIGASAPHNNVKWVSDGLGGLSNTGDAIYYSGTSKAAVFAYHPYNSQWTDVVNQSYTFTVSEDQSGSGNDNSELLYLLEKRNNAYRLVRDQVEIEGVGQCLVIAPDDYQGSIESKYDPESWAKAEKAGLVCFSPAGIRWDESIGEYKRCQYWTASPHDTSEWHAYGFGVNYHYPSYSSRNAGFPLRLSKDVTN